jgi:predicted Zn-dependent protease with MMP-like domain
MFEFSDEQFDKLISEVMDELPEKYITGLKNVAIVIADLPTPEQASQLKLRGRDLLFGLYEGIPLIKRSNNYSGVLPDKITMFKFPLLAVSHGYESLRENTKRTLWHEIAHYYGLGHDRIHELENKN